MKNIFFNNKINRNRNKKNYRSSNKKGFIKVSDHRPLSHLLTDHRPTDVTMFNRLEKKIYTEHVIEHKHSWKNTKRSSVYYLENL